MAGPRLDDDDERLGALLGAGRGNRRLEPTNPHASRLLAEMEFAGLMIKQKRDALGAGPGAPLGDVVDAGGGGWLQRHVNGAIWFRRDVGARWLFGPVHDGFLAAGGAGGTLGFPRTDWRTARDGVGQLADFEHGTVIWRRDMPAVALTGPIHAAWAALGADDWAYPYSGPVPIVSGWARCVHFRAYRAGGSTDDVSLYWSPDTGTHPVYGDIRARWAELGWENSYLGFPVTAEQPWDDPESDRVGRVQHFQRGAIAWNAADRGLTEYPDRIVAKSGHVGVSSVGGWMELVLTSAGTYTFRGHLHNSGFVGLYCTVGGQLGFTGAQDSPTFLRVKKEAYIGGTTGLDSRDEDWSEDGYDGSIRVLWDRLRASRWTFDSGIRADLGGGDFFLLVFGPLLAAAVVIGLVSGGKPEDTECSTSNWHTVKDGNNNTVYEPAGVRCHKP